MLISNCQIEYTVKFLKYTSKIKNQIKLKEESVKKITRLDIISRIYATSMQLNILNILNILNMILNKILNLR